MAEEFFAFQAGRFTMTSATRAEMSLIDLKAMGDDFELTPSDSGCYIVTPFTRPDGEAIELELTVLPNGCASQ